MEQQIAIFKQRVLDAQKFLIDIIEEYMPDKKEAIQKEKLVYSKKFKTYLSNEVMKQEINEIKEQTRLK